jgi:hypothetical protein
VASRAKNKSVTGGFKKFSFPMMLDKKMANNVLIKHKL